MSLRFTFAEDEPKKKELARCDICGRMVYKDDIYINGDGKQECDFCFFESLENAQCTYYKNDEE